MDNRVVATRLVLNELNFAGGVDTMAERVEAQKLVFLAQQLGVGLGYSYGWYIKGPYSPTLTKAYYSAEWGLGEEALSKFKLTEAAQVAVQAIKQAQAAKPEGLTSWQWLELLASITYLRRISKFGVQQAKERIADQKAHLIDYFDGALVSLEQIGLA